MKSQHNHKYIVNGVCHSRLPRQQVAYVEKKVFLLDWQCLSDLRDIRTIETARGPVFLYIL